MVVVAALEAETLNGVGGSFFLLPGEAVVDEPTDDPSPGEEGVESGGGACTEALSELPCLAATGDDDAEVDGKEVEAAET